MLPIEWEAVKTEPEYHYAYGYVFPELYLVVFDNGLFGCLLIGVFTSRVANSQKRKNLVTHYF